MDSKGVAYADALRSTIFSVRNSEIKNNTYMVEAITLDEEGMVEVTASHFPVDTDGVSTIAKEVMDTGTVFTESGY